MAVRRAPRPPRSLDRRRTVGVVRNALLLGAFAATAACRVPPEPLPPWPVDGEPLIAGAWKPADRTPERAREVEAGGSVIPARLAALDAGRWAAEVPTGAAERIPDVTVTLGERLADGTPAGTAAYDFGGFVCRYSLRVEGVAGRTVELRQRREAGPCGRAGSILLSWDEEGDLVGDWRRPGGRLWFRVRLARLEREG